MADKISWTATMDYNFITTYVDWQTTRRWDKTKTNDHNYDVLVAYLRETFDMYVSGGQCQSRMYRFKKKWYLYSHKRGLSSKPETGLGWDEDSNCFTVSTEHWSQLEAANSDYKEFKLPGSCFLYDIYTPTTQGKTATGSYAQSASQVATEQHVRLPASTSKKSRKGKAVAFKSCSNGSDADYPWAEDDVYYVPPVPGAAPGKRPASSVGNLSGEREGSRGTKSTRSSTDRERLDDAISKISHFTTVSIEDKQCRYRERSRYGVAAVQDIVNNTQLPKTVKLKVTIYFANDNNKEQRIAFVRYDKPQWYAYISLIMEELGPGLPPK